MLYVAIVVGCHDMLQPVIYCRYCRCSYYNISCGFIHYSALHEVPRGYRMVVSGWGQRAMAITSGIERDYFLLVPGVEMAYIISYYI